jgi:hypothetical protein
MTPLEAYQQKIHEKRLSYDREQAMAMQQLEKIYAALITKKKWNLFKKKNVKDCICGVT